MDLDIERPKRALKNLLNKDLQFICRAEGLQVSGVKSALQTRITDQLLRYQGDRDINALNRLRNLIGSSHLTTSSDGTSGSFASNSSTAHSSGTWPSVKGSFPDQYIMKLRFPNDPFHTIIEAKSPQMDMPAMVANRHTVVVRLALNEPLASEIAAGKDGGKLRIAVYCGSDFKGSSAHVAFPPQCEIKVNGDTFSGNLRGLKKKEGTTHPADITSLLRTRPPGYSNEISVTYAATDKKFGFVVNLIRHTSAEDLVDRIKYERRITKETILHDMRKEANDPDIVAGSRIMSLSCPIGGGRIKTPIRTIQCVHNQCFDALNFLLAQMQAPQWECPICYKPARLTSLAVDLYFLDILSNTSSTQAPTITVHPDGQWEDSTPAKKEPDKPKKKIQAISLDDSDDSDYGSPFSPSKVKSEVQTPTALFSKSPFDGPSSTTSVGTKRPAPQVIDLTLSSDEDEPPRPRKMVNTSFGPRPAGGSGNFSQRHDGRLSEHPLSFVTTSMPTRLSIPGLETGAGSAHSPFAAQSPSSPSNHYDYNNGESSMGREMGWSHEDYEHPAYR